MAIKISEKMYNVYRLLNVTNQIEEMKSLSKKELYLLLILSLDKFSEDDQTYVSNILPFKDEVMEIFDIQDGKKTSNQELKDLITETEDEYIDTDVILYNDEKLPEPYTKEEVRDKRINIITKN